MADIDAAFDAALTEDTDSLADDAPLGLYEATVVDTHLTATDRTTGFAQTIEVSDKTSQLSSVTDVLSESTGVQVRRLGGLGSLSTASIRGSTSSQVLVFLDGVPLNVGGFNAVNLGDLSLDTLEAVEIYRGSTPLELGMGSIGGAIVLRSRSLNRPVTQLTTSLGSSNTTRVLALHGDLIGPLSVLAVVSASGTDGDFEYLNRNGTPFNEDDDRLAPRSNNESHDIDSLLKLGVDLGQFRLTVLNNLMTKRQGIAGLDSVPTHSASARTLRELVGLSLEQPESQRDARLSFGADYLLLKQDFKDTNNEIGVGRQRTLSRSDTLGGRSMAVLRLSKSHETSLLVEAHYDRYEERELVDARAPDPGWRTRLGAGWQHQWQPWSWLDVVPVARGQWHRIHWPGGSQSGALTENDGRNGDRFYFSPSMGLKGAVTSWLVLRANAGRYLRPPDLAELYGDSGSVVGNPELKPEAGTNADAGITLETGAHGPIDSLRFDAAWFAAWVEDLVTYTQNSQHTLRPENVDNARIQGAEVALRIALLHSLTVSGNYTFTHGVNHSNKPYHNGKVLPGRPQHEALVRIEARRDWLNFGSHAWLELDYAGQSYLDQANLKEDTLGRALWNLGLSFRLPLCGLSLTLEARNLLDTIVLTDEQGRQRPLRDFEAYPLPGRTFYATAQWKL